MTRCEAITEAPQGPWAPVGWVATKDPSPPAGALGLLREDGPGPLHMFTSPRPWTWRLPHPCLRPTESGTGLGVHPRHMQDHLQGKWPSRD